jgi:hypothetical protein
MSETLEIITRAEAKARGLRYFWTGGACPRGHVNERYAINGDCAECARSGARDRHHPMRSTPKACVRGYVCERVSFNARCLACKRGDVRAKAAYHSHKPQPGRALTKLLWHL